MLLESVGVVSEECAKEMAEAALRLAETDFALSFTGVAALTSWKENLRERFILRWLKKMVRR